MPVGSIQYSAGRTTAASSTAAMIAATIVERINWFVVGRFMGVELLMSGMSVGFLYAIS